MIRRYLQNNRGQALVEMAMVLPVLLLILAGTIEFGRVLNQYLVVTAAAREGARAAAVGDANAEIIAEQAASSIDKGQLTVTISPDNRPRGTPVTVTVTNPVQIITPLISKFFQGNSLLVQGQAIMRME